MTFLLLFFFVQEKCWNPGAASVGGQLHQAGEEPRALIAGRELQLVWDWRRIATAWGGGPGNGQHQEHLEELL